MIHLEPHPLAGKTITVEINHPQTAPIMQFRVDDWWDRVAEESWQTSERPAAWYYALRCALQKLPSDDDVVYGHDRETHLGHILHVSELCECGANRQDKERE